MHNLGDRCFVNPAVVKKLNEIWGKDLLELNCNLHPLDGFSSHVREGLQKIEAEDPQMKVTCQDCCAANFLYQLSKMRTNPKADPGGFSAYLARCGMKPVSSPDMSTIGGTYCF